MTFAAELERFAREAKERADTVVSNIVVRVAAELDKRSPVGDASYWTTPPPKGYIGGRFRGNWQLGVGNLPAGETRRIDATGEETLSAIISTVPTEAAGEVYYLANNVPYARRIEDGWSRQAPQGIVGLTVQMFEPIVREAAEALS